VDVNLSSDDEIDASADHKAPAADDAGNVGAVSTEANASVPIVADAPELPKSPATENVRRLLLGDPTQFLRSIR
jgi:hypothetical protein